VRPSTVLCTRSPTPATVIVASPTTCIPRNTQEGHLEEKKPQKPTTGKKSGKVKQNGKEELREVQKSKKSSKSTQKLKRARKTQNEHKSSKLTLPLKSTPPNTLNASSPLDSYLSCFFSQPPG
jgi:hypothetical protein